MSDRELGIQAFTIWYKASLYSAIATLDQAIAAKDAKSPSFFKNLGGTVRSMKSSDVSTAMKELGIQSGRQMPMSTEFFSALGGKISGFKFEYVSDAVKETASTVASAVGVGVSVYLIAAAAISLYLFYQFGKGKIKA